MRPLPGRTIIVVLVLAILVVALVIAYRLAQAPSYAPSAPLGSLSETPPATYDELLNLVQSEPSTRSRADLLQMLK